MVFRTFNVERIRITASGNSITANPNNTIDLGSPTNSFKDAYLDGKIFINDTIFINSPGYKNTLLGLTLNSGITGAGNTFVGFQNGKNNTTGFSNVALGVSALFNNTNRSNLIAIGDSALYNNGLGTTNSWDATGNIAIGSKALFANTTGNYNTANGFQSLYRNTTGGNNTANGFQVLFNNTSGVDNIATGFHALFNVTSGDSNIAFGHYAGSNLTFGTNNIYIGNRGISSESNVIRIGDNQASTHLVGSVILSYDIAKNITELSKKNKCKCYLVRSTRRY